MIWRECRGLMAYADQQMSTRRIVSIGIVALLHAALGYAFVTGLAYNVIKQVPTVLETFDVQEAKPPEEEPPPPPPGFRVVAGLAAGVQRDWQSHRDFGRNLVHPARQQGFPLLFPRSEEHTSELQSLMRI